MKKILSLILTVTTILSSLIIVSAVPVTAASSMVDSLQATFTLDATNWLDTRYFELKTDKNLWNSVFNLQPQNATVTVYDGQSLRIGNANGAVAYKAENGKLVAVVNKGATDDSGYKPVIVFTAPYYGEYTYSANIELVSDVGGVEFNGFQHLDGWNECQATVSNNGSRTAEAQYVNEKVFLHPGDVLVFSMHETLGSQDAKEVAFSIKVDFLGSDGAQIKFTPNLNNAFGASYGLYASLDSDSVDDLYELATSKTSTQGREYLETGIWSATEAAPSDSSYPAYLPLDKSIDAQYAHAVHQNGAVLVTGRDDYAKYIVVKFTAPADSTYDLSTKAEYFNNMVPGKIFINGYYIRSFDLPAEVPGAGAAPTSLGQVTLTKGDNVCLMFSASEWAGTRIFDVISTYHAPSATDLGYVASILPDGENSAEINKNVNVKINVTKTGENDSTSFSASEIELNYDRNYLVFDVNASNVSEEQCLVIEGDNGINTLIIEDYGAAKNFGDVYVLSFKGIKVTEGQNPSTSSVSLVNAAFSRASDAQKGNLKTARIGNEEINVTVLKQRFSVTMDEERFSAVGEAVMGEPFSITATSVEYYDYNNVSFTMGGNGVTPAYDSASRTWTISSVTGNIVVSADVKPKSYGVTIVGKTVSNSGETASYGSNYSFTLPDDVDRTAQTHGYSYTLRNLYIGSTKIIVDGEIQNGVPGGVYSVKGRTYEINGSYVCGSIYVEIEEEIKRNDEMVVLNFDGQTAAIKGAPNQLQILLDYSFTINNPTEGYDYTISYKIGGVDYGTLAPVGGVYTIPGDLILDKVIITVTATVKKNVEIYDFLSLDGAKVFLVLNRTEKLTNQTCYAVYDFDIMGFKKMFWSDKYEAYCYLFIVKGENAVFDASEIYLRIDSGDATVVHGDGESDLQRYDINGTGNININDAQLVYNMYHDKIYGGFTYLVNIEKFLRADLNDTIGINVEDARAVSDYVITMAE